MTRTFLFSFLSLFILCIFSLSPSCIHDQLLCFFYFTFAYPAFGYTSGVFIMFNLQYMLMTTPSGSGSFSSIPWYIYVLMRRLQSYKSVRCVRMNTGVDIQATCGKK